MELVLSPGFIGDNDGSPFHNEDVHEWSHVDQLTGMLENARIETGRWQAKNQRAAQSYGKMVDSRERNSADGNVVQRAQRKVEVFQSQGAGGKSFQVVRASQWSSSRVSDLIHSSPLAKSPIEHHMSEIDSGIKSRLNDWGLNKELDSLSSLCRKIHSEVVNDSHSLFFGQNSAFLTDEKLSKAFEVIDRNKSLFNEKKSNSNENLASLIEEKESSSPSNFTRDYRVRRSLQLTNKKKEKDYSSVKLADLNNSEHDLYVSKLTELKNPQARVRAKAHLDEDKFVKNSYSSPESSPRNSYFNRNSSRSPETSTFNKTSPVPKPRTYFFKEPPEKNRESIVEIQKPTSIRLCAQDTRPVTSNKTIVHFGKPEDESTGHIKVTIDLKNAPKNEITRDSNSQENVLFLSDCSTKPTKKVGFCKTEVHFVADSGKVNIVETDGKPPPTNRFRRRRRNNSNNGLGISANKNLPVVHFGDTSYEKYIFGASKKCVSDELPNATKLREEEDYKDAWQSSFKSPLTSENENETKKDFIIESNLMNNHEKNLDQRHRGHTTTVNFGANGFCNLENIIRDDASKLCNVEEVSLEAPKIISALDLRTRKENHSSHPTDNEILTSEDNKPSIKSTATQRPMVARVDFDHSQKFINPIKKPITLSSLYPPEKSNEEGKLCRLLHSSEVEKIPLRLAKSNEAERISFRLSKLESEKNSLRLLKSNETEKVLSRLVKSNETEKVSSCPLKSSETEKVSPRFVKLSEVNKVSSNVTKTNEIENDCSESAVSVPEAKDFCDVSSGLREENCDSSSFSPIYANVFESGRNDVPIYENFQAVKNNLEAEVGSKIVKEDDNQEKGQPLKKEQEEASRKIQTQVKHKSSNLKSGSESRNRSGSESNKNSLIRRSKREVADSKEERKQNLEKAKSKTNKTVDTGSSIKLKGQKIKDKSQEEGTLKNSKNSLLKKDLKRTSSKSRNSKQPSELGTEKNSKPETSNLATKVKKPVEVVYKTAVYNMKNEKLTKPVKTKEAKGPRYINDIICGSKVKKSSTDKQRKTNAISQTNKS